MERMFNYVLRQSKRSKNTVHLWKDLASAGERMPGGTFTSKIRQANPWRLPKQVIRFDEIASIDLWRE